MSRDKQIEEMAKVIGDADQRCYEMDCDDCPLNTMELGLCKDKFLATDIYNAGYRKASEVAMEIIAIIEQRIEQNAKRLKGLDLYGKGLVRARESGYRDIKEIIEQKYTEGER